MPKPTIKPPTRDEALALAAEYVKNAAKVTAAAEKAKAVAKEIEAAQAEITAKLKSYADANPQEYKDGQKSFHLGPVQLAYRAPEAAFEFEQGKNWTDVIARAEKLKDFKALVSKAIDQKKLKSFTNEMLSKLGLKLTRPDDKFHVIIPSK